MVEEDLCESGMVQTALQNSCVIYTPTGSVWESGFSWTFANVRHSQWGCGLGGGWGAGHLEQMQSSDRVNTINTSPLHCTSSFFQCLFLIKVSQKACEPWAYFICPVIPQGFIHLRTLLVDCHKEEMKFTCFMSLFYKTDMPCTNYHTISKEQ